MSLADEIEAIQGELRAEMAAQMEENRLADGHRDDSTEILRIELNGLLKAIDAIATRIDGDRNALGF